MTKSNNNGMYFIGIDPSLTATAIVSVDEEGKLVRSHVVPTQKLIGPKRLISIKNAVLTELCNLPVPVEFVCVPMKLICIEHYAMGAKFGREAAGELGGVLRVMMFENGFEYYEVPPLRLKQFATGEGSAEKDHILLSIYKKWGIEFDKNDEADAFVLAQMARAIYLTQCGNDKEKEKLKLTAYERKVIGNILNPEKPKKDGKKVAR